MDDNTRTKRLYLPTQLTSASARECIALYIHEKCKKLGLIMKAHKVLSHTGGMFDVRHKWGVLNIIFQWQ